MTETPGSSNHSLFSIQNLEVLSLVRRELQREGFIKVFKVHIHPSCQSGDMPRLQRIIAQLGSEIMTSESESSSWLTHCMRTVSSELACDGTEAHLPSAETPGVTHIVYPFGPKGDPDDGQEYLRCLEKRYLALASLNPVLWALPIASCMWSAAGGQGLSCVTAAPVWGVCARAVMCVQGRLLPGALLVPPRQL